MLNSISTGAYSQHGTAAADDTMSEVAPSEYGRVGSRMSMRHEWEGADDGGSQKGTLKGMFKKQKKCKQIELDALRCVLVGLHAQQEFQGGGVGALAAGLALTSVMVVVGRGGGGV